MARAKAKTVKARVAVVYSDKGEYQAGGWRGTANPVDDEGLIEDAYDAALQDRAAHPHACIVEIELPVPKPLEGTVVKVTKVKA